MRTWTLAICLLAAGCERSTQTPTISPPAATPAPPVAQEGVPRGIVPVRQPEAPPAPAGPALGSTPACP